MTSFFSASAAGFSLSRISSASSRFRVRAKGSAIWRPAQIDRGLARVQIQLADVHLGAEQLGARLFGGVLRDRLGEDHHQHAQGS